jgi:hypothetical protein
MQSFTAGIADSLVYTVLMAEVMLSYQKKFAAPFGGLAVGA